MHDKNVLMQYHKHTHTVAHLHIYIYKHIHTQVTNIYIILDTCVLECMHKRAHVLTLAHTNERTK